MLNVKGEVDFSEALVVRPDDSPLVVSPILSSFPNGVVEREVSQAVIELALSPTPLVSSSKSKNSEWVLSMVISFRHLVGVSCEDHEEELRSLFATLKNERNLSCAKTPSKSGSHCLRELKGLNSSVYYEGKTYVSEKSRKEGRGQQKSL